MLNLLSSFTFLPPCGSDLLIDCTGPPPGANMGMGMMNPEMMGMMPQHDMAMGFDLSPGIAQTLQPRSACIHTPKQVSAHFSSCDR